MVIKINQITESSQEIEEKEIKKLVKDFNKLAKLKKSKYKIKINYQYPHLVKRILFFQDYENQIVYNNYLKSFSFCNEINENDFNEFKDILEELTQEFKIDLIKIKEKK